MKQSLVDRFNIGGCILLKENSLIWRNKKSHLSDNAINKLMNTKFHDWFQEKVLRFDEMEISTRIKALARGPCNIARRFSGYIINGYRFHTKNREIGLTTQNSGVVDVSEVDGMNYYEKVDDIIEINYYGNFKVVLFKCDWVNVYQNSGMKVDKFGFTFVNFNRLIHTGEKVEDDPFVFASQVEQVFYVNDIRNDGWSLVVKTKPRDFIDMGKEMPSHVDSPMLQNEVDGNLFSMEEQPSWVRNDINNHVV